jgi:hypothetical protein
MKIGKVLFSIIFSIPILTVTGQNKRPVLDTVLINDICVENICFGDSISKIIKHFGKPDEVWYRPAGDWEFEEPTHKEYWYNNTIFYEILYPNLSDSLLYGCRIDMNKVSVSIKGTKMVIGETVINNIIDIFPYSIANLVRPKASKEFHVALYVILPSILEKIKGAFIFKINLYFSDNQILRQVETQFDLN